MSEIFLPAPFRLILRDSVGSTNDEARRLVQGRTAADFVVVSANSQTRGRGRRGRTWVSPAGNLHCSIVLAVSDLGTAAQLGFVAAVALCEALPGLPVTCKWPNDLLVGGRKAAGMLLEPTGKSWLILGLGVDVEHAPSPDEVQFPAASLAEYGYDGDALAVLSAFCGRFGPWVERWRQEGFSPVREVWLAHAGGLGHPITVRLEAETLTGRFSGLDEDGALLLDQSETGVRRIMAGDVFFPV